MLPNWFNKWNADNPTNIYGPAIAIGVVGGAVLVAAWLVSANQSSAVDSLQTGPRGTGMSVPEFKSDLGEPDPGIAGYMATRSDPLVPQGGEELAGDARENVPPGLEGLTVENYDRLLAAMRQWTGIPNLFEDMDSYQTSVGYTMIGMTQNLNENWDGHVNANKEVGVTCYTCHRGQPVPSDIWFDISPVNERVEGWGAVQNRVTPLSSYTSLPSDALQTYLVDGESIKVHDLASRVAGVLNFMGVEFADVNVLADDAIRQGIKDFSDWPTVPQLYVKGEFVGGCDIVTEMTLSGELDTLFDDKGVAYSKDAAEKIREANA